ncbi:MAG: HlyD family efflux transporter periplasmic adaptor subunit, partial [Lachnospiraceae bacterium]|nr:HlyD family efflux transporter periplasmic adaptor subunit [Lachnospiraceae bacterium]
GTISSVTGYQARLEAARPKVKNAQANVDSLTRQVAIVSGTNSVEDLTVALKKAQTAMSSAQERMTQKEMEKDAAIGQRDALTSIEVLEGDLQKAENDNKIAKFVLYERIALTDIGSGPFNIHYTNGDESDVNYAFAEDDNTKNALFSYVQKQTSADITDNKTTTADALYNSYLSAKANVEAIRAEIAAYDEKKSTLDEAVRNAESEYNKAKNHYNECKTYYEKLSNQDTQNTVDNGKLKEQLSIQLSDAEAALKKAQEEQTQLLTDVGQELNLSSQNSIIADKQKEIAKLRENAVGATVVAPMDGTVISVSKIAGEETMPEEALATMVATGKGFTVSFSVTNEQAKRATVGEQAEIQNSWYYGDLKATLQTIRPDKENPAQKKELTFSVEGEVQDGQSLSLSVGQKSSNYDMLVPNSAIKEDNTGKFILIVEVKNSPLGNRYKARRVDVEVLASDDTQTAIIGDVNSYEYVITTSTKPIAAGDLVRISDN